MAYKIEDWEEDIKEAVKNSMSMSEAASKLSMNFKTFRRLAIKIGVYSPNPSGKGIQKRVRSDKFLLKDILEGKYPQYQSYKLKNRLLAEGIKEHQCENCKLREWLNKPIPLELHHKDGNSTNHKEKNLELRCCNCHALTENYRSKNKKV